MQSNSKSGQKRQQQRGQFDQMLEAWQDGKDVAWSDLMAAWVKTPTAPLSSETVNKLIKHLDAK